MPTNTYLRHNNGMVQETRTVEISTGAMDASGIPNLNAAGVLDLSIVNGKNASAGAGDAGKVVALDGAGRIDVSMLPVGLTVEALSVTASETIAAGDWCNLWNSSGLKVRKADAAAAGRRAHCYAPAGIANGAAGTVYFEGANTGVSGRTPGAMQWLSATTPGLATETAPAAPAAAFSQIIGTATSATAVNFCPLEPINLV